MTSRSKCASFSISQMSWSRAGPRRPAVKILVLSGTGAPVAFVKRSGFDMLNSHFQKKINSLISVARVSFVKGRMGLAMDERGHIVRVLSAQASRFVCRHVVLDEWCHVGHAIHAGSVVISPRPPQRRYRRRNASAILTMAP